MVHFSSGELNVCFVIDMNNYVNISLKHSQFLHIVSPCNP